MDERTIEIGSVVALNSGGPLMTVLTEYEGVYKGRFACVWFYEGKLSQADFWKECLTLVEIEEHAIEEE